MKKSFLEIKNISTEEVTIESIVLEPNEVIKLLLSDISNAVWKNIIGLVNKKILEYNVIKEDVEEVQVVEDKQEDIQEEQPKEVKKKKTTKKEDTSSDKTTKKKTKKKKE